MNPQGYHAPQPSKEPSYPTNTSKLGMVMSISDEEILAKFKQNESKNWAFDMLVRKYQVRLYQHIRKMVVSHEDTDDLLQDTFVKVWQSLENFRGEAQLFTWVYRIATNECLRFLQKKRSFLGVPILDISERLATELDKSMPFSADEVADKLQKAVLKLPDKQRLVFNMKYYEDLNYEAISEILGTSVGALKASYHHAVKKIEDQLQKEF